MADDWRICIAFGGASVRSIRQALITALSSRLGDQVAVSSNATQIFLYAPSIGLADEAALVAREVLAQRNISVGTVRTEGWSWREREWRDADEMPADPAPDRQEQERARHAYIQEQERERPASTGLPAWGASTTYRLVLASLVCGIAPLGLGWIAIGGHIHSGLFAVGFIDAFFEILIGARLSGNPDKRIRRIGRIAIALGLLGIAAVAWATGWQNWGGGM